MVTRWEVQDAVWASQIEPAGKLLMVALLSRPTGDSVVVESRYAPTFDELAGMTGYSRSTVADWMKALATAGWYERDGGATRSAGGYILAIGDPQVQLPKRVRPAKAVAEPIESIGPVTGPKGAVLEGEILSPGGLVLVRSPDQSLVAVPPISPVTRPDKSGSQTNDSPVTGPNDDAPIRNLPTGDAVPTDSPSSPSSGGGAVNDGHTSVSGWQEADRKTAPAVVAHNPPRVKQPALPIPRILDRLPDAVQIVFDSLVPTYPKITPDDARLVHRAVVAAYPGKVNVNYLRGMARNDSFVSFYEPIHQERTQALAEKIDTQIRALQATEPECEHEWSAGRAPHPITGEPLCPWCRTGRPAPEMPAREGTHPDLAQILAAFRAASADRDLHAGELIAFTRDASNLRRAGLPTHQIADLARRAGEAGISLLAAARTREDQPA